MSKVASVEGERAAVCSHCSLLLSRSNENTKGYCFSMSNALTCSGEKVHVESMDSDSSRFMAMAAEIMLFFPL